MDWIWKLADYGWSALLAVASAALGWFFYIERKFSTFQLHVSEHYVKKTDLSAFKDDIAADLKEVKDGQAQIIDLLLGQKIGTTSRRRR